ncbi:uncharacterized protein LOC144626161 [Crassostrea virginica]
MPTPFDILIGSFYSLRTTLRIKLSTSWEDVNIVGNGLQNLGRCLAGITLSRERILSCHTDCHRVSYFLRWRELSKSGVRFVTKGQGTTFSQDLEPEYISYSSDETKAYICLQENNAIAVVDMQAENISAIYGLGFKDWIQATKMEVRKIKCCPWIS